MISPAPPRLRYREHGEQPYCRPTRWQQRQGDLLGEHHHDFYEVFWIEEGSGRHPVNGERWQLAAGDCVFIRPGDQHGFQKDDAGVFAWTNVAIPAEMERQLRRRYADELGWWPWRGGALPHRCRLQPSQVERLKEQAASLPVARQRRLDLDWFIASVLRCLDPPGLRREASGTPYWLDEAVARFLDDDHALLEGTPALVALAGRCREHVNRTVRAHYRMTSTELVRHLRLERAARELRLSNRAIVDIALSCGFANISYFYRSFRARYGSPPRRFRIQSGAG